MLEYGLHVYQMRMQEVSLMSFSLFFTLFALALGLLLESSSSIRFKATPENVLKSQFITFEKIVGITILNIVR